MENNNPLVSIVVITYNSSKYVLETLESVKAQTYQNIELIVSDDYSPDNTVEICRNWIEENKDRFVRTELITVEKNTGISANCNRGVKAAKGEWIKLIAGDDALESYYCEQVVAHLRDNPNILCMFTNITKYKDLFAETNVIMKTDLNKFRKIFNPETTPEQQFQYLLRNVIDGTTGVIINKKVYEDLGYYNEKYPFFEDRPFWLKITKAGIKLFLLEIYGAKYREHSDSVLRKNKQNKLWTRYKESYYHAAMDWLEYYPYFERLQRKFILRIEYFFYKLFSNKKNFFISSTIFILNIFPIFIIRQINKNYR